VVKQISRRTVLVDKTALIQVTIDRFEDGDGPGRLLYGEPLGRGEREPLREVGGDLSRPRLDQTRRMDTVLGGVEVPWVGTNKALWISALVHSDRYRIDVTKR
jgi:hypothetical protein